MAVLELDFSKDSKDFTSEEKAALNNAASKVYKALEAWSRIYFRGASLPFEYDKDGAAVGLVEFDYIYSILAVARARKNKTPVKDMSGMNADELVPYVYEVISPVIKAKISNYSVLKLRSFYSMLDKAGVGTEMGDYGISSIAAPLKACIEEVLDEKLQAPQIVIENMPLEHAQETIMAHLESGEATQKEIENFIQKFYLQIKDKRWKLDFVGKIGELFKKEGIISEDFSNKAGTAISVLDKKISEIAIKNNGKRNKKSINIFDYVHSVNEKFFELENKAAFGYALIENVKDPDLEKINNYIATSYKGVDDVRDRKAFIKLLLLRIFKVEKLSDSQIEKIDGIFMQYPKKSDNDQFYIKAVRDFLIATISSQENLAKDLYEEYPGHIYLSPYDNLLLAAHYLKEGYSANAKKVLKSVAYELLSKNGQYAYDKLQEATDLRQETERGSIVNRAMLALEVKPKPMREVIEDVGDVVLLQAAVNLAKRDQNVHALEMLKYVRANKSSKKGEIAKDIYRMADKNEWRPAFFTARSRVEDHAKITRDIEKLSEKPKAGALWANPLNDKPATPKKSREVNFLAGEFSDSEDDSSDNSRKDSDSSSEDLLSPESK